MSDNEKLKINLQLFAGNKGDDPIIDEDTTTDEELPVEEQKAVNHQDLIYIKKYLNDHHYDMAETEAIMSSMVKAAVAREIAENTYTKNQIDDKFYTKNQIDANHYTKTKIDTNHYTKTDACENFCERTDTAVRAYVAEKMAYTTVAPTASPEEGTLIICVLTEEPETKYDRVIYLKSEE